MHQFVKGLEKVLEEAGNKENAGWMKSYMKNQFDFLGIQTPVRRSLAKAYFKQHQINFATDIQQIVTECFNKNQREFQYAAIELIAFYKKQWTASLIDVLEYCILHKSWWDTVDHVGSECLGIFFAKFPEHIIPVTQKWNHSHNIWLQRSSIMFQKSFKKDTDTQLLAAYILHVKGSKEFFVQKAIGWALREYAKTNTAWVKDFVATNELPALSKREALKHHR